MDTPRESVQVLETDPGLGEGLSPAQLSVAARLVVASVLRLGTGVWEFEAVQMPDAGFLVVQGCITREVVILGETAAIEFLAEGDLLRPTGEVGLASVDSDVVWQVLEPTPSCGARPRLPAQRAAVAGGDGGAVQAAGTPGRVAVKRPRDQPRAARRASCGFSCCSGSSSTAGARSAAVR